MRSRLISVSHSLKRAFLLLSVLGLALLASAPAAAQRGAITVSRNLSQLTDRAGIIVRGNVISAKVEKHPELGGHTIVVTLRVKKTLKGQVGDTFVFRQYIWDIRDRYDAAGYQKGQEVLLMMLTPNRYGLTSPAGMDQGRFRILRNREGKEVAVNGVGNFKLFHGMEAQVQAKAARLSPQLAKMLQEKRARPVPVQDLELLITDSVKGSE